MTKVPTTKSSYAVDGGTQKPDRTASFDLMPGDDVSSAGLGAKVEVTIEGTVIELRGIEQTEYDKKKGFYPGKMRIEVTKFSVECCGEFDGMDDDEG